MRFRSLPALRTAAGLAVLASVSLVHADWYTWVGTDPDGYGDPNNWQNQIDGHLAFPGVTDNIAFNRNNGVSNLNLDQDREHYYGQFEQTDLNLASHTLKLYVLEAYGASVHDGTLNATVLNVWSSADPDVTTLTNVQATVDGLNVYENGKLDLVGSAVSGNFGVYSGGTMNLTNTSMVADYGQLASGVIDANSTVTLGANVTPDVYNATLTTNTGVLRLDGTLSAVGSAMGLGTSASAPRTSSSMTVGSTGSWTDTTATVNSLGFGGDFSLDVDGGSVQFANDVNIGEGNYDRATNEGIDGKGFLVVENGGSFSARNISLGGWSRYGVVNTEQIASGSGDIIVRNGGTLNANQIFATDQSRLNRGSSSLYLDQGGTANVGYLLGGAHGLDETTGQNFFLAVQTGSTYIGGAVDLIGAPGKTVTATFLGANTTVDVQRLAAYNGARMTASGVGSLTLSTVQVGANYSATTPANIRIENGDVLFKNKTDTYNPVWAVNGDLDLLNVHMTVAPNQQVSFQAGAGGDSGSGTLTIVDSTFDGAGGLFAGAYGDNPNGYGYANVQNSTLMFRSIYPDGSAFSSAVGIGDSGRGSAYFQNSTVDSSRFRVGAFSGGNGGVTVRDSSITAHSTDFTATHPGAITIGNEGKAVVELFNSTLNAPKTYIGTQGVLKGDGFLNGDPLTGVGTTVENHGIISPGHSPGVLRVGGDLNLTSTSVLEMEIDLSDPSKYDQILTSGTVTLGGTLRLKALGTGTFDLSRSYTLLTATGFVGGFSGYEIDPAFGIDASAFSFNGGSFGINPQAVPEPSSFAALSLTAFAVLRRRARARR